MRMKYFTRGMGIGFIIASMIFMIAFAFYRPKMSEEQIRTEAAKLGMIDPSLPSGLMSDQESDSKSEATDDKGADTKESDMEEDKSLSGHNQPFNVLSGGGQEALFPHVLNSKHTGKT